MQNLFFLGIKKNDKQGATSLLYNKQYKFLHRAQRFSCWLLPRLAIFFSSFFTLDHRLRTYIESRREEERERKRKRDLEYWTGSHVNFAESQSFIIQP